MQTLVEKLKNNTSDKELKLKNLDFIDDEQQHTAFSHALKQNTSTQILVLTMLNQKNCELISKSIMQNKNIKVLCFLGGDDSNMADPSLVIEQAPAQVIFVDLSHIPAMFIASTMSAISQKKNISQVRVNFLNSEALAAFFDHLDKCTQISKLILGSSDPSIVNKFIEYLNKRTQPIDLIISSKIAFEIIDKILIEIVNKKITVLGNAFEARVYIAEQKDKLAAKNNAMTLKIASPPINQNQPMGAPADLNKNQIQASKELIAKTPSVPPQLPSPPKNQNQTIDLTTTSNNNKRKKNNSTSKSNITIKKHKTNTPELYSAIAIAILRTENEFLKDQDKWYTASKNDLRQLSHALSVQVVSSANKTGQLFIQKPKEAQQATVINNSPHIIMPSSPILAGQPVTAIVPTPASVNETTGKTLNSEK